MSKMMEFYDTIRQGQEVVEELHWQPPPGMTNEDAARLAKLDKALDLIQEVLLDILADEPLDGPDEGVPFVGA